MGRIMKRRKREIKTNGRRRKTRRMSKIRRKRVQMG